MSRSVEQIFLELSLFKGTARNQVIASTLRSLMRVRGLTCLMLYEIGDRSMLFQCWQLRWSSRQSAITVHLETSFSDHVWHIDKMFKTLKADEK